MRLLCWNVAGRVTRLPEQAACVVGAAPDVVCLQELTARTRRMWSDALADAGWPEVALSDVDPETGGQPGRPLYVLTAARGPLTVQEIPGLPWPERTLASIVAGIKVVNVHSPISPKPGLVKVRTHEALFSYLSRRGEPTLVCGDFNTPRKEHPDGTVWTFARNKYGKLRPERGERWDRAELALIKGLEEHGYRDAFRSLHGLEVRELSWEWPRWGGGYRLDHLIVSRHLAVSEVTYLHDWRKAGLSDHSPLLAELDL